MRSTILVLLLTAVVSAQKPSLEWYLPGDHDHDPAIPTPASVLGWEVGEWHVRHDQLTAYVRAVAEASDRVAVRTIGHSHERRELLMLTITSPGNHARIDEIRSRQLQLADPSKPKPDTASMPVVTWMGYSVHGNEPSGANAALLFVYHLAAARTPAVERLLDESVILVDPCLNPDGFARFSHWANTHRGVRVNPDPEHREHREGWPNGRTNHYWFDLNRDWLLLTHPESRARVREFHAWHPNVLTDFHEMGTDTTYFFQPGIPSRQNPLTPQRCFDLTARLAERHAAKLDGVGSLYFTEEMFDDFYYGKGSTYPDVHGTVGILFEQASSRGHAQRNSHGVLTFPFTVRNQLLTSMSSVEGAHAMRAELLAWKRDFYRGAIGSASADPVRSWVFGHDLDRARVHRMLEILRAHRIRVHRLASDVSAGGRTFRAGSAWVVPASQPQYRLAKSLFERRTTFKDDAFYDVSAWTFPLAFGIPYAALGGEHSDDLLGEAVTTPVFPAGEGPGDGAAYGWLFEWDGYFAPRALRRLLDAGVRARVATSPFTHATDRGENDFGRGTIFVARGTQTVPEARIRQLLAEAAREDGVTIHTASGGLTPAGSDLGSSTLVALEAPRVALLVGEGVRAYDAGEVWHVLDERFGVSVSLIEKHHFGRVDLDEYTHVVVVDGSYDEIDEAGQAAIRRWLQKGGCLVGCKRGGIWAARFMPETDVTKESSGPTEPLTSGSYGEVERHRAARVIGGAIFEARCDLTHPLCYGLGDAVLPTFRNHTRVVPPDPDPFATPVRNRGLLAGHASEENRGRVTGSAVVIARKVGEGTVVRLVDNTNFRGVWYGANRIFMNAVFFGRIIASTSLDRPDRDHH